MPSPSLADCCFLAAAHLVVHLRTDVGSVDGGVTSGRPAGATRHERGVIDAPDGQCAWLGIGPRDLGVAFQAEVIVPFYQHFGVDGTVRLVADGASLPERLMLVNVRLGLFSMALSACFV